MQKIGGLLREAGIERRGFQEWRCGVGGGLGARYGCGLFAKLRRGEVGSVVSVYGMEHFVFKRHLEQFKRKIGRETIRALLTVSSRSFFNRSRYCRYSRSSARKVFIRSWAFSCLAGINSLLASSE